MKKIIFSLFFTLLGIICGHTQVTNVTSSLVNVDGNGCVKFYRLHITTGNQPDSIRVDFNLDIFDASLYYLFNTVEHVYKFLPANTTTDIDYTTRNWYVSGIGTNPPPNVTNALELGYSIFSYTANSVISSQNPIPYHPYDNSNTNCGVLVINNHLVESFIGQELIDVKYDVPVVITNAGGSFTLSPNKVKPLYGIGGFCSEYIGIDVTQPFTVSIDPNYLQTNNFVSMLNTDYINPGAFTFYDFPDRISTYSMVDNVHIPYFFLKCAQNCEKLKINTYINGILINTNVPYDFTNNTTAAINTVFKDNSGYYRGFESSVNYTIQPNALWLSNNGFSIDPNQVVTTQINNQSLDIYLTNTSNLILKINSSGNGMPNIYNNVPYDFIDANNVVKTIYPFDTTYYVVSQGLNQNYTVRANPQWLNQNNSAQVTPNFTVNEPNPNNVSTHNVTINCIQNNAQNNALNYSVQDYVAFDFVMPIERGFVNFKICNNACLANNQGTVSLDYPSILAPDTSYFSQFDNPVVSGNTFSFQVSNLYGCKNYLLKFYIPGNTPDSTLLNFSLSIQDNTGLETNLTDNLRYFDCYALNSYDPNDKHSDKPRYINPDAKDTLTYTINFQNEGSLQAYKIVVRDTISPLLNLNTLKVLASKHQMDYTVDPNTREVVFTFNNIFLAPRSESEEGSKGYVIYSIEENDNNPVGSELRNTAYIYFDFNPPIITNTAVNINSKGLSAESLLMQDAMVYPNPAKEIIHIKGVESGNISLIDITGKIISEAADSNHISVAGIQKGMYLVKIESSGYSVIKQVVVE